MPTSFPGGYDTFNEPTIPEETTLSSAGTGTRNHTEHHRDMGDAVEALQHGTALKDHDHSGTDPLNPTDKLAQANTHESADTDTGVDSLHHTLGPDGGQAAAGDHAHDYNGPSIFNQPLKLCTSVTRPPPHPGLHIYETDTNRWRVWATFDQNVSFEGLNSTDQFTGTFPNGMDPALWEMTLSSGDLVHGHPVTGSGLLSWADGGVAPNRAVARRINAADKETQTDDQVITWKTGPTPVESSFFHTEYASNDQYFRMSADKQSYIRVRVLAGDFIQVFYTVTGQANEKLLGQLNNVAYDPPGAEWIGQLVDRTLSLWRDGTFLGSVADTSGLAAKGAANRGWATGLVAGDSAIFGQTTPMAIDSIRIQDYAYHYATNRWTVLPVASVPICRLRQSLKQQLVSTGTIIHWQEELEDSFDYFGAANSTDIIIREPGLYLIEVGIQWDPQYVPDIAHVVACINGQETTVRNQQFMRGNVFQPGFSQTLQLAGKLRFAANEVLTIKTSYTAGPGLLNLIFSWFDAPSKINSRIDIMYLAP